MQTVNIAAFYFNTALEEYVNYPDYFTTHFSK